MLNSDNELSTLNNIAFIQLFVSFQKTSCIDRYCTIIAWKETIDNLLLEYEFIGFVYWQAAGHTPHFMYKTSFNLFFKKKNNNEA